MKIAIIEDEKLTAKDLARTINKINPAIEIVAFLTSVEDATIYLHSKPDIDLIFSDIQLGDGNSFDIFNQFESLPPIIFCTAYNEYALEAFKSAGIEYILKPFDENLVQKALTKYFNLKHKLNPNIEYQSVFEQLNSKINSNQILPNSILIHQGDRIIPLDFAKVAIFYIDEERTLAHTFDGKVFIINYQMEKLENLTFGTFFRANRQFLVHKKAISFVSQYFNRKMIVTLSIPFKQQIVVGKLKTTALLNFLAE